MTEQKGKQRLKHVVPLMVFLIIITGMAVSCIPPVGFGVDDGSGTTGYETTVHVSWAGVAVDNPAKKDSREVVWEGTDQDIIGDFDDPIGYYTSHFTEMTLALGMLLGNTNSGTRIAPPGFADGVTLEATGLRHNPYYTNSATNHGGPYPLDLTVTTDDLSGTEVITCDNYREYVDTFRRDKFNKARITVENYIRQFKSGGKVFDGKVYKKIADKYSTSLAAGLMADLLSKFGIEMEAINWRYHISTTMNVDSYGNPVTYYEGLGSVWFGSSRAMFKLKNGELNDLLSTTP